MAWLHEEHSSPRINWAQTFGRGKKKNWVPPKKWHPSRPKKKVQFCRGSMELIWKIWSSSLFYFPCWLFFFSILNWPFHLDLGGFTSKKFERLQIVSTNCTYELREELERNNSDLYIVYIYIYTSKMILSSLCQGDNFKIQGSSPKFLRALTNHHRLSHTWSLFLVFQVFFFCWFFAFAVASSCNLLVIRGEILAAIGWGSHWFCWSNVKKED